MMENAVPTKEHNNEKAPSNMPVVYSNQVAFITFPDLNHNQ